MVPPADNGDLSHYCGDTMGLFCKTSCSPEESIVNVQLLSPLEDDAAHLPTVTDKVVSILSALDACNKL